MEKIIICGEMNHILSDVVGILEASYQVQVCSGGTDALDTMIKVLKPRLIIYNQMAVEGINRSMLQFLIDKQGREPVLVVGREGSFSDLSRLDTGRKLYHMSTPINPAALIDRCNNLLGINGGVQSAVRLRKAEDDKDVMSYSIMVVDDSAVFYRSIKSVLEQYYTVHYANSGERALELIPQKNPDVIILDYEMPDMDGCETFKRLKENWRTKDIPVIFLTAVSNEKNVLKILELGPTAYLLKPINSQDLLERVQAVIKEID